MILVKHNFVDNLLSSKEVVDNFNSLKSVTKTDRDLNLKKVERKDVGYKDYLQLHDFKTKHQQECIDTYNKFVKFNKFYTLQEIKKEGLELISVRERINDSNKSQKKVTDQFVILSEYI